MGIFLGVLVGFVMGLILAGAAFIDIISTDNGRGYQPNKPLDGSPPNARSSVQHVVWAQRNRAHLEIDQNYFYYDDTPIGIITDDDPYFWNVRIFKNLKETCFNPRTGRLEILTICRNREDKQ